MAEMISKEQIKNIWGFSKDVGINKDELYCIIERIKGIRFIVKKERMLMVDVILFFKEKRYIVLLIFLVGTITITGLMVL